MGIKSERGKLDRKRGGIEQRTGRWNKQKLKISSSKLKDLQSGQATAVCNSSEIPAGVLRQSHICRGERETERKRLH